MRYQSRCSRASPNASRHVHGITVARQLQVGQFVQGIFENYIQGIFENLCLLYETLPQLQLARFHLEKDSAIRI